LLGSEKWGIGPTGVVLKQEGSWSYGMLANHVWSYAGDDDRSDISSTFFQPFVTYNSKTATSFTLQTEATYKWKNKKWSVPVNDIIAQVLKIGPQLIQLKAGIRYWADSAPGDPEGWGFKLGLVLLFRSEEERALYIESFNIRDRIKEGNNRNRGWALQARLMGFMDLTDQRIMHSYSGKSTEVSICRPELPHTMNPA
jgi:hypothetical protein